MQNIETAINTNDTISAGANVGKQGEVAGNTGGITNPGESNPAPEPDTTGIDTNADKTKQELFPIEQKLK